MQTGNGSPDLASLNKSLEFVSHSDEAVKILRDFAKAYKKTANLQSVFNEHDALLKIPILYEDMRSAGLCGEDEPFSVLQGDVVITESAYILGKRAEGQDAIYIVGNSTCDTSPGRRPVAVLYPVTPIVKPDEDKIQEFNSTLSSAIKFHSTMYMYLPRFSWQNTEDVAGNLIDFTRPHQIESGALQIATRKYSMTETCWRIFSSLCRFIHSREANNEARMRSFVPVKEEADEAG